MQGLSEGWCQQNLQPPAIIPAQRATGEEACSEGSPALGGPPVVQKGTEGEPGGQDDGTLLGAEGGVWNVLLGPFRSFLLLGHPACGRMGRSLVLPPMWGVGI